MLHKNQNCQQNCLAINHIKSVLLPEEGGFINFENFKRWTKALLIICDDFECVLIPSTDNINFGPNTKKRKYCIVCSYSYKLICVDEGYMKPYKTYLGADALDKCFNVMIKENKSFSKINETEFNKPLVMTKKGSWRFYKLYEMLDLWKWIWKSWNESKRSWLHHWRTSRMCASIISSKS